MFGGSREVTVSTEYVLDRIDQLEVWHHILGVHVEINQMFSSPFRSDKNPGCKLSQGNSFIFFSDYGDPVMNNSNVISAIMKTKRLNYNEALSYINRIFIKPKGKKVIIKKRVESSQVKVEKTKVITVEPWKNAKGDEVFKRIDKEYWSKWDITITQLSRDGVKSVKSFLISDMAGPDKLVKCSVNILSYSYHIGSKVKIYRPMFKKSLKWYTNMTNELGQMESLPESGMSLIITKSYKDCRILRNLGYCSVWTASEAIFPTVEVMNQLKSRFKNIYVLFDLDDAGVKNTIKFVSLFEFITPLYLPKVFFEKHEVTDSAELYEHSKSELIKFLKIKVL